VRTGKPTRSRLDPLCAGLSFQPLNMAARAPAQTPPAPLTSVDAFGKAQNVKAPPHVRAIAMIGHAVR
jgi:hypothetical protein